MQERRHLVPGDIVADADVGHQIDQQAPAVFAQILRAHPHAHRVGDRDRPVLRDVVLGVYRSHCGEREVEAGHQRHHRWKSQRERIGQRHLVAVAQTGDRRVGRDVGGVDRQLLDGHRPVGQLVCPGHHG